jgi:hypothetical protein
VGDVVKAIIGSPPVLLLCLGLVFVLLGILGRSPLASVPFILGRVQRGIVAAIGLGLASTGFWLLLPAPDRFAIGGTVTDTAGTPIPDAIVEAHDDATSDKPANQAHTDDGGAFYLNYNKDDEGRYVRLRVVKENFDPFTKNALVTPHFATLAFSLTRAGENHAADTSAAGRVPISGDALDFAPLRSGQLVVWRSTGPQSYSSTIATSFAQDFPAGKLTELDVSPKNFVSEAQSPPSGKPAPDIAFIDNYTQLEPLVDAHLVWSVWGTPRFPTNGWWVIFKNTKHLAQAQAFARWLNRAPGWQPRAKNISISTEGIRVVQNASIDALHDLMTSDQGALETLLDREAAWSDRDAARSRLEKAGLDVEVSDVQPVLTFGNSRIAFVLLAVVASGDDFYGMRHMIFVFRNEGTGSRILHIQPDAQMPNAAGVQGLEANPALLRSFDNLLLAIVQASRHRRWFLLIHRIARRCPVFRRAPTSLGAARRQAMWLSYSKQRLPIRSPKWQLEIGGGIIYPSPKCPTPCSPSRNELRFASVHSHIAGGFGRSILQARFLSVHGGS